MFLVDINIEDLRNMLFVLTSQKDYVEPQKIANITKVVNKFSPETKEIVIFNPEIIFYINNIERFKQEASWINISDVNDRVYTYLYYKVLNSYYESIDNNERRKIFETTKIKICCKKTFGDNNLIAIQKIMKSTSFLVEYRKKNSVTIDIKKIDSCYVGKASDIAKGAKKSIIGTLIGYKIENTFRKNPQSKYQIIEFKDLTRKNLELADKQITVHCPICNKKTTINKDNIEQIITVINNKIRFNCNHLGTDYIKQYPFETDLNVYFEEYKHMNIMNKRMFFLNNFDKLIRLDK